jgi:chromosome segregation protein
LSDLEAICRENAERVEWVRAEKPQESDMREPLRVARARSSAAVGRHERAQARVDELEHERMRLSEEIFRELELQVGGLPATFEGDVPTEDEIRRLRSRVLQYADLDESVVSEYREIQERQEYLTAQLRDLREAADGLRQIMELADEEMRTRFRAALGAVTDEFCHVFRTMLRGGEARLEQVDADGGIEVQATLPGKRARSSAAFSGGERALVASSLLFAVLRTRPTPFCVLDEVDAALDETNVDRYLSSLREISDRTQVIVVTHNRATMAAANALYGLTMDGDGASGVLSVRLDAYEAAV